MPNPLFGLIKPSSSTGPFGNFGQLLQKFKEFRQSFQGDPRAEVQRLLNSGQMTQEQFNQLQGVAQQFMQLMQ